MPEKFDRITRDPDKMEGQPCIRGMRLTVRRVLEIVALHPDRTVFKEYPDLEEEDLVQALEFADFGKYENGTGVCRTRP